MDERTRVSDRGITIMSDIFKTGSTIRENCRCRTTINGIINAKGIAQFHCPACHNQWSYAVRGKLSIGRKGTGSHFSSSELENLLKSHSVSINCVVG